MNWINKQIYTHLYTKQNKKILAFLSLLLYDSLHVTSFSLHLLLFYPSSLSLSCRSRSLLISFSSCRYFLSMKRFWWAIWGKLSAGDKRQRTCKIENQDFHNLQHYNSCFKWHCNKQLIPITCENIYSKTISNFFFFFFWKMQQSLTFLQRIHGCTHLSLLNTVRIK